MEIVEDRQDADKNKPSSIKQRVGGACFEQIPDQKVKAEKSEKWRQKWEKKKRHFRGRHGEMKVGRQTEGREGGRAVRNASCSTSRLLLLEINP